jgi:hypothetical protein
MDVSIKQSGDIKINIEPIVGAIVAVAIEPWAELIRQLHEAGRVTDDEIKKLRDEIADRDTRLAELVQKELFAAKKAKP